jgi:hypothetical protein
MVCRYDRLLDKYICSGIFCSTNCVRAYMLAHHALLSNEGCLHLTLFMVKVFGIPEVSNRPALPRHRLKMFGGSLSIEEFRAGFSMPKIERVVNPPFIMERLTFVQVLTDNGPGKTVTDILHEKAKARSRARDREQEEKVNVNNNRVMMSDGGVGERSGSSTESMEDEIIRTTVKHGDTSLTNNDLSIFDQLLQQLKLHNNDTKKAQAAVISAAEARSRLSPTVLPGRQPSNKKTKH